MDSLESSGSFDGHGIAIGCIQAALRPGKEQHCLSNQGFRMSRNFWAVAEKSELHWSQCSLYTSYDNALAIKGQARL